MAIPGVLRSCRRSYAGVFLRLQDRNLQLAAIYLSSHRLMFERGSQMRRTENVELTVLCLLQDGDLRKHLVEELADVLMYYNDILLCYGISAEELKQSYISKFEKNMKRW
jgi:hypothetical protein